MIPLNKLLKNSDPTPLKAAKGLMKLGGFWLFVSLWNTVLTFRWAIKIDAFKSSVYFADLLMIFCCGLVCLLASYGVKNQKHWGKKLGQYGLVLGYAGFCFLMICVFYIFFLRHLFNPEIPEMPSNNAAYLFIAFVTLGFILVFGQFARTVYHGVKYLGRLPDIPEEFIAPVATDEDIAPHSAAALTEAVEEQETDKDFMMSAQGNEACPLCGKPLRVSLSNKLTSRDLVLVCCPRLKEGEIIVDVLPIFSPTLVKSAWALDLPHQRSKLPMTRVSALI